MGLIFPKITETHGNRIQSEVEYMILRSVVTDYLPLLMRVIIVLIMEFIILTMVLTGFMKKRFLLLIRGKYLLMVKKFMCLVIHNLTFPLMEEPAGII
jgi:hypothetical protein